MADSDPPRKGAIGSAIAMIVLGLLVFVPSGLCTGVLMFGSLWTTMSNPNLSVDLSSALMVLIIGGPFVLGGGALLWFGIKELRAYFRN